MTKEELIKSAVSLVTAYPQNVHTGSGNTLFTSSAEVYYNIKVPAAMENFIYGFGVASYALANPIIDVNDSDYKIFAIPKNVGFIFTVCKATALPSIEAIIGVKGLRRTPSSFFSKLPDSKIRIYYPNEYKNELVIGFIDTNPSTEVMTASFRLYVMYDIAQQLAVKNIQQRSVAQQLSLEALIQKRKAQKFALDNYSLYSYSQASLAKSPFLKDAYIEKAPEDPIETYYRGI